uniref:Uncharacterized protein n=1 Tax=Falco tinnunculus TaxID=100819 RepID=A0A8C4U948_FALTI
MGAGSARRRDSFRSTQHHTWHQQQGWRRCSCVHHSSDGRRQQHKLQHERLRLDMRRRLFPVRSAQQWGWGPGRLGSLFLHSSWVVHLYEKNLKDQHRHCTFNHKQEFRIKLFLSLMCRHIYRYTSVYVHVHTWMNLCVYIYVYIYVFVYIHVPIQTYIHTHIYFSFQREIDLCKASSWMTQIWLLKSCRAEQ